MTFRKALAQKFQAYHNYGQVIMPDDDGFRLELSKSFKDKVYVDPAIGERLIADRKSVLRTIELLAHTLFQTAPRTVCEILGLNLEDIDVDSAAKKIAKEALDQDFWR